MKIYFLILLLLILALPEMWVMMPMTDRFIHPFIFQPSQEISVSSFIWIGCMKTIPVIVGHILWKFIPRYKFESSVFFWLSVGNVIDYFLKYNARFGTFHSIPIAYSTFMLLAFTCLILFNFSKLLRNE